MLQVGVISGKDPLLSLQTAMQSVIAPVIFSSSSWPDTIRKDLHAATHKFMSVLVQRVNAKHGDTILYLPKIDSTADPSEVSRDNELVQLLETCIIHATRQVKDVLNKQDDLSRSGSGGPLAEIKFWRARSADLSRIRSQMDSPDCSHIITVLSPPSSFSTCKTTDFFAEGCSLHFSEHHGTHAGHHCTPTVPAVA
jgi:dynein heavy chain, axonemal